MCYVLAITFAFGLTAMSCNKNDSREMALAIGCWAVVLLAWFFWLLS